MRTSGRSLLCLALLCISSVCIESIPIPVQAQDPSPQTELVVTVTGSRGGAVENATVTQRYRATRGSRTQTSGSIPYTHVGQGRYEASVNTAKFSTGKYSYALEVSAPDYATEVFNSSALEGREVELVHNNYYARCNQDWEEGWIGRDGPWEDCKVDPERLIETFGTKTKRFQTKPVPEDIDPRTPVEQLPDIWSSFEVNRPLPAFDASEEIHLQTRRAVYEKLIEAVALAPARAKALAQSRTLYRRIEERLKTDEQIEWKRLAEGEAAVSDILGEAVSTGSESVKALGNLGEAVSLGLKLGEAWEAGRLEGLLRIVVYQSSSGKSVDWAMKRIERLASGSSLQNDPAFASALQNVREKIERQQSLSPEELVQRYRNDRIIEVAAEIFISMGAEAAVKTLATKALAATGAKASLAAAGAGGLASAGALGVAWVTVDAIESASERKRERLLLLMAPLLDEFLRVYPDGSPRVDLTTLRCEKKPVWTEQFSQQNFEALRKVLRDARSSPFNPSTLSTEEQWGTLMRLQLGVLFNQTRLSYVRGIKQSVSGDFLDRVTESWKQEQSAYRQCMAAVSGRKISRAEKLISKIASAQVESLDKPSSDDGTMDLALILDSSGSMSESDPDDLRIDAAKMIIDQLPQGTSASVVDFDGSAQALVSSTNAFTQRQQLRRAAEQIDANGGTHIGNALTEGARALQSGSQQRNVGLLLTDGKGKYNGEIARYESNGWCLYTVALGPKPNLQLLRSLADSTCGEYMKATSAIDVSREFGQVLNDIQKTPLLATRQGELKPDESAQHTVSVDQTVEDLRLQLTWPGSSMELQLTGPQGRSVGTGVAQGRTYAVVRAEDVRSGQYTVEVIAREVDSAGEPYQLMVSGSSSLRPETTQFPTSVRPNRTAPIQVELPAADVLPRSVQAEVTQYANGGGANPVSLTRHQRGDTLSFVGQLPPTDTEGDRRVVVRLTGDTRGGSSFHRVVDRTYTVTPDAEIARPTIERAIGTQVVLRGARAFGLQPGLTIYVQAPDGRRVGEGIITSTDGSRATVDLQAVMGANEITPRYVISYDPVQWRADR